MAAKDLFHDAAKSALEKDGWTITDDPLYVRVTRRIGLFIDLGAEKLLVAERRGQKIAVEIKSFLGMSVVNEFHLAIGQFLNYRIALKRTESDRKLYLAIPQDTYADLFIDEFIQQVIEENQIKLIVFDPKREVILQWKD
jgi:hypothetical protein